MSDDTLVLEPTSCLDPARVSTRATRRARIGKPKMLRRIATVTVILLVAATFGRTQQGPAATPAPAEETSAWVCPMHSDYTADNQGTCPRCGMALVHAAPFDVRDYD